MCASPPTWISLGLASLEEQYPVLVRQLTRALRDPLLAQDLIHEAVAEALTKLRNDEIEDPRRLTGFVHGIAQNLLKNHRRRHCNRPSLHLRDYALDELQSGDDPADLHLRCELAQQIRTQIGLLSTVRDRELLCRFYLREEEKDSVCAALKLDPARFHRVLFRARQRMRALVTD